MIQINHITWYLEEHYFSKSSNLRKIKREKEEWWERKRKGKEGRKEKKKRRLVLCRKMEKRGSGETRTALRENTWASSGGGRKPQAKTFQQTGKCAGPFPEAQETQAAACHKQRVFLAPRGSWQGLTKHKSNGKRSLLPFFPTQSLISHHMTAGLYKQGPWTSGLWAH